MNAVGKSGEQLKKLELLSTPASSNSYAYFVVSDFPGAPVTRYIYAR